MILNVSDISAAECRTAFSSSQLLTFTCLACKPNEFRDNLALVCVCLVTRGWANHGGELSTERVGYRASLPGGELSKAWASRLKGKLVRGRVFLLPLPPSFIPSELLQKYVETDGKTALFSTTKFINTRTVWKKRWRATQIKLLFPLRPGMSAL